MTTVQNAATMGDFMTGVYNDVRSFWTQSLTAAGYQGARVPQPFYTWLAPGQSVNEGCADAQGNSATSDATANFCSADQTIYFSVSMAEQIWNGTLTANSDQTTGPSGDFSVAYAIAHEYGHAVQFALGIYAANAATTPTKQFELQADCLAGVWAHSVYDRGQLESGDVEEAVTAAAKVGDYDFGSTGHHGTPVERQQAFMTGYNSGQGDQCTLSLGDPSA
jgi:predicted metalloprotease